MNRAAASGTSTLPKAVAEMRASQRHSVADNQQSGRTVNYTYDSLHRVKTALTNGSAGYPQWGLSWSYDRYGNRTVQTVTAGSGPSSSPTISTTTNRITALGGSNYSYDTNGNNTQDDLFKYKYDAENRVVEIRNLSDTLLSSYAYDGHSMQVIKVVGADRWWFLYAGGQLVCEFSDAASATYNPGTTPGTAQSDTTSTLLYQHSDHLTTRVTTDNAGTLSNEQAHYPYGENWYATGTADPSVKRKFTSYRKETDSSLASGQISYATARYHAARVGRFQRPTPRGGGSASGPNGYSYGPNDPVNHSGPAERDDSDEPVIPPKRPVNPPNPLTPDFSQCGFDPLCHFALMNCAVSGRDCSNFNWASVSAFAHDVWDYTQYIMGAGSPYGLPILPGSPGFGVGGYDLSGGFGLGGGLGGGFGFVDLTWPNWVTSCGSTTANIVDCEQCCEVQGAAEKSRCSLRCLVWLNPIRVLSCVARYIEDNVHIRNCRTCCAIQSDPRRSPSPEMTEACTGRRP